MCRLCSGRVRLRWPAQPAGSPPHRAAGRLPPAAGPNGQPRPPADQSLDGCCPGRSACAVCMRKPCHKVNTGTAAPLSSMCGGCSSNATGCDLSDSLRMAEEVSTAGHSCNAAAGSTFVQSLHLAAQRGPAQQAVHCCRRLQRAVHCQKMQTRGCILPGTVYTKELLQQALHCCRCLQLAASHCTESSHS